MIELKDRDIVLDIYDSPGYWIKSREEPLSKTVYVTPIEDTTGLNKRR